MEHETAIQSLQDSIAKIQNLKNSKRNSPEHFQWDLDTLTILEDIFGFNSLTYQSFNNLTWQPSGGHIIRNPLDMQEVEYIRQEAYLEHLGIAEGILKSGLNQIKRKGVKDVYEGKDATDKNIVIISLISNQLRKVIRTKPGKEKEVQDKLEDLFIGAGLDGQYVRETEHISFSTKASIPDFTFNRLNTVVEVKLCKSDDNEKNNEKKIISEINDDIVTYKKKYSNVIFAIYDLGIIRNQDQSKADIEANDVVVLVVKH